MAMFANALVQWIGTSRGYNLRTIVNVPQRKFVSSQPASLVAPPPINISIAPIEPRESVSIRTSADQP